MIRNIKEIAEDLINSGLNEPQVKLLNELLEAAGADYVADTENAKPEGDDSD